MMTPNDPPPLYLFYGNQVDAILKARDRALDEIVEPEWRAENVTEYKPESNKFGVELKTILPEIAGDLATMSFISGERKVVLVTNPAELYSGGWGGRPAKKKKATAKTGAESEAKDPFAWLRDGLPQTGNHLILLAFEDEAGGREVNDRGQLFQAIGAIGHVQRFRDTKAFFRIEDALLQRNAAACLTAVRDLWKPGKGDAAVYAAAVRCLRFMLQAGIGRERPGARGPELAGVLFPARAQFNIFKTSPNVQRKYLNRRAPYRTGALLEAYEELLDVYRALRPRPGELFVPDQRPMLERTLMKLFASAPPGR